MSYFKEKILRNNNKIIIKINVLTIHEYKYDKFKVKEVKFII